MKYLVAGGAPWAWQTYLRVSEPASKWSYLPMGAGAPSALLEMVSKEPLRYVFFVNWSRLVSADVLTAVECVNFHCTPLPYGRGGHPVENMILQGFTTTVIAAHRMTEEVDAGPIYLGAGPIKIGRYASVVHDEHHVVPDGTKAEIQARFIEPVAELIRYIVQHEPEPEPQVGEPAYFKRLPQAEYEQFWAERAKAQHV